LAHRHNTDTTTQRHDTLTEDPQEQEQQVKNAEN
jgi:hypothetical protein